MDLIGEWRTKSWWIVKAEAVLRGGQPPYPEDIRKSPPTHQGRGRDISHQLLENKVPNSPTPKSPGGSRKTKVNPQGSTRRGFAMENQDHPK